MSNKPNTAEELVRTKIKSRDVTYYLASEQDLKSIRGKAVAADLAILLASIFIGAYVSYDVAQIAAPGTGSGLGQSNRFILAGGLIFFVFGVVVHALNYAAIRAIIKSGEVQAFSKAEQASFTIDKAVYGTGMPDHELDITERVREHVRDNKLEVAASNELAGGDPHPGIKKTLAITFSSSGVTRTKDFVEGQVIQLP